jgi:hypothetical protein
VDSLSDLAWLYRAEGRHEDALSIIQKLIAINSNARNRFFNSLSLDVLYRSQSNNLIGSRQGVEASYELLQRSASSAAGNAVAKLSARFAAATTELGQLVRKDQDLTAEAERLDKDIVAAVSKLPTERNAAVENRVRKRIDEIRSERDKLQEVFNKNFPDYVALSKPQPLSINETQTDLSRDEALIAFDFGEESFVWIITQDRAEWKELSVSAEEVFKEVEILRAALEPAASKLFDDALSYRLYKQILEPIERVISTKTRLSFILSGALTSLPPQVLITSDPEGKDLSSVDWLARKYAIR